MSEMKWMYFSDTEENKIGVTEVNTDVLHLQYGGGKTYVTEMNVEAQACISVT